MSMTNKSSTATARIRSKNQITLPQDVCNVLGVSEGEYLAFSTVVETKSVKVEAGTILVRPMRLTSAWSEEEWKRREAEADEDIKHGRLTGPYKTPKQALRALDRSVASRKKHKGD